MELDGIEFLFQVAVKKQLNYDLVFNDIYDSLLTWENEILNNEEKRSIVIVSMKNIPRMKKIDKLLSTLIENHNIDLLNIPTLIIDDECDHVYKKANPESEDQDNDRQ